MRAVALLLAIAVLPAAARTPRYFVATAYSVEGTTSTGHETHRGLVAADPGVLSFGTRIRIKGAGSYSGLYTVEDAGRKVNGAHLDLYVPTTAEAKKFGRRRVRVYVLARPR